MKYLVLTAALVSLLAAKKPPAPEYRQCKGSVCVVALKWAAGIDGRYHVTGALQNGTVESLADVRLEFDLYSGTNILGTEYVTARIIPSGITWSFELEAPLLQGDLVVTRIQPARLAVDVAGRRLQDKLDFPAVQNPKRNLR